jgi:uracil-DNA glycosylase
VNDIFAGTSGPRDADIVLVGEAYGYEEAQAGKPFVGSSGTELNRMLGEAGLDRSRILCTNVVNERPAGNEMWRFFEPGTPGPSGVGGLKPGPQVLAGLSTLYQLIAAHPRRLVIAAGNYPLWALTQGCTGTTKLRESNRRKIPVEEQRLVPNGIGKWRGSMWYMQQHKLDVLEGHEPLGIPQEGLPLLPIIHPAAILRDWSQRSVTVHDLKARVPLALGGNWRADPAPVFLAPPTYEQCVSRLRGWLSHAQSGGGVRLAADIETARGFITCLGLADSARFAMSIPFIRKEDDGSFGSWWTPEQEAEIWRLLRAIFLHEGILIEGQNFIYDTQYIQREGSVTPKLAFDSMLAQNVMFPGTPKGLDYLSSLYCQYHWYWKEDHKEWDAKGKIEDLLIYNAWDCVRTWEVCETQRKLITALDLEPQMSIKMRTNDLCLRMMNRGVLFDNSRKAQNCFDLAEFIDQTEQELLRIIPQEWVDPEYPASRDKLEGKAKKYVYWFTSDKQSKFVFGELLGLPTVANRKTGSATSGKEARNEWGKKFPVWRGLLDRVAALETASNTISVINSRLDRDGRIRSSYNPGGTETHRLSSSKNAFGGGTNLQNLSKGKGDYADD